MRRRVPQQVPDGAGALHHVSRPEQHHVEQAIVGADVMPQLDQRRNHLAAVGDQDQRRLGLGPGSVDRDGHARHVEFFQQPEGRRHVCRELPLVLVGRRGSRHDPRVVARAACHREVVLAIAPAHLSQVQPPRPSLHYCLGRAHRMGRNPEVACQQVAGAARYHAQAHAGSHQRRRGLHGGAVSPEHRHHVHAFRHSILRQPARITGAACRQHLALPSAGAEGAHHRRHRVGMSPRRSGIDYDQHPAQNSFSQRMSKPIWYVLVGWNWLSIRQSL